MKNVSKVVTGDPFHNPQLTACFACGSHSQKRPTVYVHLTDQQMFARSAVDTSPFVNPFKDEPDRTFLMCTDCRSSSAGWTVICDVKRYGKRARAALQSWKRRVEKDVKTQSHFCHICRILELAGKVDQIPKTDEPKQIISVNLRLYEVLLRDVEYRELFCQDLSRRSEIEVQEARDILKAVAKTKFCSLHHNQSRHAANAAARVDPGTRGAIAGFCVFKDHGCFENSKSLRPLAMYKKETLEDTEAYLDAMDAVNTVSCGRLSLEDVTGKQVCANCRYVISKGITGVRPNFLINELKDSADRCLVDFVLFALDANNYTAEYCRVNEVSFRLANELKANIISSLPNVTTSRFLPVPEVVKLRAVLNDHAAHPSANICQKTIESRLCSVLAARNVHMYSLTRKFRCYATSDALADTVNGAISLSITNDTPLFPKERRRLVAFVSNRFIKLRENFRRGEWQLSKEIAAVPRRLWSSLILDMASNRQFASWKIRASSKGLHVDDMFPISNDASQLPREDIDNYSKCLLHKYSEDRIITRADFLLCLRAFRVLEQIVFSRSRVSIGPLMMTTSIAGIMESSASWTSTLHCQGIVVSYDTTEQFRKDLIAEREESCDGAFHNVDLNDRVVTVQLDNFDILPFNSVKAAGKRLPMVSGTATQSIVQTKRRKVDPSLHLVPSQIASNVELPSGWLDSSLVPSLRDRKSFVSSLHSESDERDLKRLVKERQACGAPQ